MIRLEAAVLGYPDRKIAGPLDLEIRPGELLLVVGPNGCGKSTLLKTLLGSLPLLSGKRILPEGLRLGYVPQRAALDPAYPFTTEEIVGSAQALATVGLEPQRARLYRELSGGQKQRALLARALASCPSLLLLDEPADGLDLGAERDMSDLVLRMRRDQGVAVVQVSHLYRPFDDAARVLLLGGGKALCGQASGILDPGPLSAAFGRPVGVEKVRGQRLLIMEEAP